MHCYYCIMSTGQQPVADLCVLDATSDADALVRSRDAAERNGPVDRLAVYHGERLVASIAVAQPSAGEAE